MRGGESTKSKSLQILYMGAWAIGYTNNCCYEATYEYIRRNGFLLPDGKHETVGYLGR